MLFGILGLIAAAAFWYWRIKAVGEVATDVHDVAGRLWGKHKRKKFLGKVNDSPLEVIDDPATAAVILMNVIATEDGVPGHIAEAAIRTEVEQRVSVELLLVEREELRLRFEQSLESLGLRLFPVSDGRCSGVLAFAFPLALLMASAVHAASAESLSSLLEIITPLGTPPRAARSGQSRNSPTYQETAAAI